MDIAQDQSESRPIEKAEWGQSFALAAALWKAWTGTCFLNNVTIALFIVLVAKQCLRF